MDLQNIFKQLFQDIYSHLITIFSYISIYNSLKKNLVKVTKDITILEIQY